MVYQHDKVVAVSSLTNSEIFQNVYSTDETVVGRWIDGKPIYRKVVTGLQAPSKSESGYSSSNRYSEYGKNSLNADSLVSMRGFITNANNTSTNLPIRTSGTQDSNGNTFTLFWANGYLEVYLASYATTAWGNMPVSVILEYTKTTDAPTVSLSVDTFAKPSATVIYDNFESEEIQ